MAKETVYLDLGILGDEVECEVEYTYERGYPANNEDPGCPEEWDILRVSTIGSAGNVIDLSYLCDEHTDGKIIEELKNAIGDDY